MMSVSEGGRGVREVAYILLQTSHKWGQEGRESKIQKKCGHH